MSGILAIWNLNSTPVDVELVRKLTRSPEVAGPDAQEMWTDGPIGLDHAMFLTMYEARDEWQPMALYQSLDHR